MLLDDLTNNEKVLLYKSNGISSNDINLQRDVNYPLQVIDLFLSKKIKNSKSLTPYSERVIRTANINLLRPLFGSLNLSINDPFLRDRLIRILRFKLLINRDLPHYNREFEVNLWEIICRELLSEKAECSDFGKRVMENLIRVASSRILINPSQSILEPIMNSIDSYKILKNMEPIGKFGFGFFTLFGWLFYSNENKLMVESTTLNTFGNFESWTLYITYNKTIKIKFVPSNSLKFTGTKVQLIGSFPINDILNTLTRINFMDDYITTDVNNDDYTKVQILVDDKNIQITDYSTGISQSILWTTLLVPSISTKVSTNILDNNLQLGELTGFRRKLSGFTFPFEKNYYLLILVGNIIVEKYELDDENIKYSMIVQLSENTPIAISRDKILYNDRVNDELEMNFDNLFSECLGDIDKIYTFINSLELLNYNKLLNKYLETYKDAYYIPIKYINFYMKIGLSPIIPIKEDFIKIESENKILYDSGVSLKWNVYKTMAIIFIDKLGMNATTGGSRQILFVDREYSNTENWIYSLSISFSELNLEIGGGYTDIENVISNRILGLTTWYRVSSPNIKKVLSDLFENNNNFLDRPNSIKIYNQWFIYISRLKPKNVYGQDRPLLKHNIQENSIYNISYNDRKYTEKISEIILDIISELVQFASDYKTLYYPTVNIWFPWIKKIPNLKETDDYLFLFLLKDLYDINDQNEVISLLEWWKKQHINNVRREILYIYFLAGFHDSIVKYKFLIQIYNPAEMYINYYRSGINLKYPLDDFNKVLIGRYPLSLILQDVFSSKFDKNKLITLNSNIEPIENRLISIVINEGTSRSFIKSMIIETFNNAYDASLNILNSKVNMSISNDKNIITYSIENEGFISLDGLMFLSIPFASSKSSSVNNVGEMGTGFFTVYKDSKKVMIETKINGMNLLIEDTPIRESNRVVDVLRNVYKISKNIEKTKISIKYETESREESSSNLTEAGLIVRTFISGANKLTLYLNDELITLPKKLLVEKSYYSLYSIPSGFTSLVTTNGAPYNYLSSLDLKLPDYLRSVIDTGYLLNINSPGYIARQARDSISIKSEEEMMEVLKIGIYINLLETQLKDPSLNLLPNFTSTAKASQVYPVGYLDDPKKESEWNLNDFIIYFNPNKIFYQSIQDIFFLIRTNPSYKINDLQFKVVEAWYSNKSKDEKTHMVPVNNNNKYIFPQKFVNAYWELLPDSYKLNNSPPSVVIGDSTYKGCYKREEHKIILNYKDLPNDPNYINSVSLYEYIRGVGREMYGMLYPASTLVHELTHSWQKNLGSESHNDIIIDGERLLFDDAANKVFQKVLENGLLNIIV